jgi:peptidoglycan/xylan/chitin deacetylase (PgdA/CDA1 family)
LTRNKLRILCYHGFSVDDEHKFASDMFMTGPTFQRRLEHLKRKGYSVLPLDEALDLLAKGKLPPRATAITIDDGFYSVKKIAVPLLREYGFPATIYVSTYYVERQNPVFRLAVRYLVWKSDKSESDLSDLGYVGDGNDPITLQDDSVGSGPMWQLVDYAERSLSEDERVQLIDRIGRHLGVDETSLSSRRILNLLTSDEIIELSELGFDIQLHTHRHRFPSNLPMAVKELEDSQHVLRPLVKNELVHFCYPSGRMQPEHAAILKHAGIVSATTCEAGLADRNSPPLALPRLLDGEHASQLCFEAALCGLTDWLGRIRSRLRLDS